MSRSRQLRRDYDISVREHQSSVSLAPPHVMVASVTIDTNRLLSSKALDFWSLAVCSCALSLLCHSFANAPQVPGAAGNSPVQTSTPSTGANAVLPFQPFTLTSPQPEVKQEDEE